MKSFRLRGYCSRTFLYVFFSVKFAIKKEEKGRKSKTNENRENPKKRGRDIP